MSESFESNNYVGIDNVCNRTEGNAVATLPFVVENQLYYEKTIQGPLENYFEFGINPNYVDAYPDKVVEWYASRDSFFLPSVVQPISQSFIPDQLDLIDHGICGIGPNFPQCKFKAVSRVQGGVQYISNDVTLKCTGAGCCLKELSEEEVYFPDNNYCSQAPEIYIGCDIDGYLGTGHIVTDPLLESNPTWKWFCESGTIEQEIPRGSYQFNGAPGSYCTQMEVTDALGRVREFSCE